MKNNLLLFLICLILANSYALGETFDVYNVKIKCPSQVEVGRIFNVEYTLENLSPEIADKIIFKVGDIDSNVKLLFDDKTNITTINSMINGKVYEKTSLTWTFTFLALNKGSWTTPSFSAFAPDKLNLKQIRSKVELIDKKVDKDSDNSASGMEEISSGKKPENKHVKTFLKGSVDKETIELGDTITFNLKFISNAEYVKMLFFESPLMIEDVFMIPDNDNLDQKLVEIDGENFYETIIQTIKIIPLKRGVVKIPQAEINGKAGFYTDFTDPFRETGLNRKEEEFKSHSKPLKIKVK